MNYIIKIKCPFDGAVLSVKNQPGIERKSVTCPVCRNKYPFTQYTRIDGGTGGGTGGDTEMPKVNLALGRLRVMDSEAEYRLREGRNVIGRRATHSKADFQIDTGPNRYMSREHLVIDVVMKPVRGLVHYARLYKDQVNATYVGTARLLPGDCVILNDGDTLRLPDATLMFDIPDAETTEITGVSEK